MSVLMYDDITVANYPPDAQMAAGYVDGAWPTFNGLAAQCPHARLVSITVFGGNADVCDCETGDLTPAQAAAWAKRRHDQGLIAIIYCSYSVWEQVRNECAAVGVTPDGYWIADYDGNPNIDPVWVQMGCVAKQYQSTNTYDISSVLPSWPAGAGSPVQPTPGGYDVPLPTDIIKRIFTPDGYWHLRADGTLLRPPGVAWRPHRMLRSDGDVYTFPYTENGVTYNDFADLPAPDKLGGGWISDCWLIDPAVVGS